MTARAGNTTLVDYRRTGGIRGLNDHLVIDTEGSARLQRKTVRREFVIHRDTLAELHGRLRAIDFSKLRRSYTPSRPGADLMEYEIRNGPHVVHAVDTAVPDVLLPLIQLLNGLIDTR